MTWTALMFAGVTVAAKVAGVVIAARQSERKRDRFMTPPLGCKCSCSRTASSVDHQSICMECADHHVDPIAGSNEVALVRKHHPIFLSDLRRCRLPQHAHLVHDRNLQHDTAAF